MSDLHLNAIRTSYDRVADAYTEAIFHELENKPFDRDVLRRFAVAVAGRGPVCDMGCGPGQIARFLRDQGVEATGLDLSPGMVEQARCLNPDIGFSEGDMTALDLDDGSLGAITAFYAIVNLTAELRLKAFRDMARVLAREGLLLLAFHCLGAEDARLSLAVRVNGLNSPDRTCRLELIPLSRRGNVCHLVWPGSRCSLHAVAQSTPTKR